MGAKFGENFPAALVQEAVGQYRAQGLGFIDVAGKTVSQVAFTFQVADQGLQG